MAAMRGPRTQVGSADWITEERASALNVAQAEAEEFSFSVRNEFDWLNEHMADVFNENEINIAEVFKTPGKLRGKTPRTARKLNNNGETRVPLSDIFSSASKVSTPFAQQLGRIHSPKLHTSQARSPLASRTISPLKLQPAQNAQQPKQAAQPADSGYYGSQSQDLMTVDSPVQETQPTQLASPARYADVSDHVAFHTTPEAPTSPTISRTIQSPTRTFQTAKEEQTTRPLPDPTSSSPVMSRSPMRSPLKHTPAPAHHLISSPARAAQSSSPKKSSPLKPVPRDDFDIHMSNTPGAEDEEDEDEQGTPSDSSSPIRPVMRKSSLNFASLPAREPLTSKKSLGPRSSRPSNDHRTSHYGMHTTGKSFGGNVTILGESDDDDDMDMEGEANTTESQTQTQEDLSKHHKTYTQRLQDQINMLGKSQPNASRQSKSIPSSAVVQPATQQAEAEAVQDGEPSTPAKSTARSPARKQVAPPTPGAFPEDEDEDDWIAPPTAPQRDDVLSPRPALPKSHTADVMEGIYDASSVGGAEFVLPKQRQVDSRPASPQRAPAVPDRSTSGVGHHKSASVSVLPEPGSRLLEIGSPKKGVSVSNPTLALVDAHSRPGSPPKSPSRSFRDSPLKQVKNKLSSIIKSSKGLLASSAVLSAEGKASLMSPSTTRLGLHAGPSTESLAQRPQTSASLYPDLSSRMGADVQSVTSGSPTRPVSRRTRASVEREKEEKRREREAEREARLQAEQMSKLEKAREKEREKARVFSKEQEKAAPVAETPAPKDSAKPIRTSPRKMKPLTEAANQAGGDADVDMIDAASAMPPPSVPRSAGPSQATRGKEVRRPVKPPKDAPVARQAPTVIRVNTGSQHSQYRPSNAALASGLRDTLAAPPSQLRNKTSQASLQSKPSLQSLKGSASSGRPKALEMAAKRKEQEEREAQRKREAKLEIEKKRAALQEEERRADQQKRQEAEQQKEKGRDQTTAKKNASRQAALEKAKQTRAPPPAVRSQPTGPPDYAAGGAGQARPPSRLATASQRSQDDAGKPVNTLLSHGSKASAKRPLQQEGSDAGRNPQARNGMSYQAQEAKRRRTSDDFFDELDMESQQPNIKGPPVRPSGGLKKDMPAKSMYSTGYTTAPPQSASRDLFKATVTAQHTSAVKTTQHMDMSQFSKGAIPFAPNPNSASQHKTPARPPVGGAAKSTAKSAPRSSPRFQNGESIELPEIETDDEDEDEDDSHIGVASWADSPELRRALMRQEPMDPGAIFGPPAPLNMEEVFSKSKDKWHKFRARTSSANWSGADRLTEDDIRKDLAARDKMRREGAWSYEMSKDLN